MFDFLRKGKLSPIWRYETTGVLWRLVPTDAGKLLGEQRDLVKKSVSFFCLSQMTGEVLWENLAVGDHWWSGIEAVHRDVFFVHGFATPDLPEHKSITAVDLLSGTKLWSNDELNFILAVDDSVFASRNSLEGNHLLELEYRTGAILRSFGTNEEVLREARIRSAGSAVDLLQFPAPLDKSDANIFEAIQKLVPFEKLIGPVEMIELDGALIFNYHEPCPQQGKNELRVNNILRVIDKGSDSVIFGDIINAEAPAIVPESFFVQHGTLFYIKNRTTLTAVRIASTSTVA